MERNLENKDILIKVLKTESEVDDELEDTEYINYYDNNCNIDILEEDVSSRANIKVTPENEAVGKKEVKTEKETDDQLHDDDAIACENINYDYNRYIDNPEESLKSCEDVDTEAAIQNDTLLSPRAVVVFSRKGLFEIKRNKQRRTPNSNRKEVGSFVCEICQKHFQKKKSLKFHLISHSDKEPKSHKQEVYSQPSELRRRKLIYGEKPHQCGTCNKCFDYPSDLKKHILIHTGEKPFQCDVCKRFFRHSSHLKKHLLIHTGEKPFQCDVCKKFFRELGNLKKHMLIHTGKKPYQCDVCNESFNHSSYIKRHLLIHTGEKPFQCHVCKKFFRELGHLKKHMLIHAGKKPFQCELCKKCFGHLSTLQRHSLIHAGKKPFQCDICNKSFKRLSNLKGHILIHTGEKPFQCDVCKKFFKEFGNLKKHMLIHTGKKPYQCDVCNKCFSQLSSLNSHAFIHTEKKPL